MPGAGDPRCPRSQPERGAQGAAHRSLSALLSSSKLMGERRAGKRQKSSSTSGLLQKPRLPTPPRHTAAASLPAGLRHHSASSRPSLQAAAAPGPGIPALASPLRHRYFGIPAPAFPAREAPAPRSALRAPPGPAPPGTAHLGRAGDPTGSARLRSSLWRRGSSAKAEGVGKCGPEPQRWLRAGTSERCVSLSWAGRAFREGL